MAMIRGLLSGGAPSFTDFANTTTVAGLLGLIVVSLIIGWLVPGYISKQKDKEVERLRVELADLRKSIDEKFLPAMNESTNTLKEAIRLLSRRT